MSNFKLLAQHVTKMLQHFSNTEVFSICEPGDGIGQELWDHYIASFPEGTNPIFRVRTEHDGSYDKNYIRQIGGLVTVGIKGNVNTIWDNGDSLPYPYNVVSQSMALKVREYPIKTLFRTKERVYGHRPNTDDTGCHFEHFFSQMHPNWVTNSDIDRGKWNTNVDVIKRTVELLMPNQDSFSTVLELIDANSLYRGQEFRSNVKEFQMFLVRVEELDSAKLMNNISWTKGNSALATFKNSSIGSLVCDIASGVEITEAVRLYESKVAPQNYRRTAAIVTPSMVKEGMTKLEEMGLRDSLERCNAVAGDINVRDVLWVNRSVTKNLSGDPLMDSLMAGTKKSKNASKAGKDGGKMLLADFISTCLKDAEKVELLATNSLRKNFMVMTAPEYPNAPDLFKWSGSIGWTYAGNVTDAITERVKAAGGNIDAPLRFSLAWYNGDDMDLHMTDPRYGDEVYYGQKVSRVANLDVDMNGGFTTNRIDPVENIYVKQAIDGDYIIKVHQYSSRQRDNQGWTLQVALDNVVVGEWSSKDNKTTYLRFTLKSGEISLTSQKGATLDFVMGQGRSVEYWNVKTEEFSEVSMVLLSPNHWTEETGNRHTFFILKDCKCPDDTRGIYNEFLRPELYEHRKLFDLIANKTMIPANENEQLAGIGISETRSGEFTFRVTTDGVPTIYTVINKE